MHPLPVHLFPSLKQLPSFLIPSTPFEKLLSQSRACSPTAEQEQEVLRTSPQHTSKCTQVLLPAQVPSLPRQGGFSTISEVDSQDEPALYLGFMPVSNHSL